MLNDAEENASPAHPALVKLLEGLRGTPRLGQLEGTMQVAGPSARPFDSIWVAAWLLRRSSDVGPEEALAGLRRYLTTKTFTFSSIQAVEGLKLGRAVRFGNGIRLVPWNDLERTQLSHTIWLQFLRAPGIHHLNSAMVREQRLRVEHSASSDTNFDTAALDTTAFEDALLLVGVAVGGAPVARAAWLEPPAWAPIHTGGFEIPYVEGRSPTIRLTANEMRTIRRLLRAFEAMPTNQRDLLRLVMRRLSRARRRRELVEKAIDIGIAMEALFLDEQEAELSFRLRIRAARWLRRERRGREAFMRVIRDAYNVRSKAVHTGAVPRTYKGQDTGALLGECDRLVGEAVRLFLVRGKPDWMDVLLR